MKAVRHPGDMGLLVVLLLRVASGLIANYPFCATLAVSLCRACHWLLCGKLSRVFFSGPMLIIAEGITTVMFLSQLDSSQRGIYEHGSQHGKW